PQGGDELNLIEPGRNYGWPVVTYGEEYSGEPIEGSVTQREGYEQPVYYWDPVIAPSGAQFYSGDAFPEWQGSLFIGGLKDGRLVRLTLEDDRVFDYPWLYAVEVGHWELSEAEARRLREYLDRGGFLMVDDFWGEYEWSVFMESLRRVFPDKQVVDLPENHELLHVLYDLDQRTQIPGSAACATRRRTGAACSTTTAG
nr:hypothetical protein [Gammaproteobacteria bacterium]